MGLKEACHINVKILPFKFHFFFMLGGFAGVMPFMPLIAKQLGINATAVGVGYSLIPIFVFLSNPLFGLLVDYFQNIKIFLIFLVIGGAISFISVSLLPPIAHEAEDKAFIRIVHLDETEPLINLTMSFKRTCVHELLEKDMNCFLVLKNKDSFCQNNESISSNFSDSVPVIYNETLSETANEVPNDKYWITFYIDKTTVIDAKCKANYSTAFQCIPTIRQCLFHDDYSSVFHTYQYWTFVTLAILGGITFLSAATLSSTACYEALGSQIEAYGRQRLFGTISWGIVCPTAGMLNDLSGTNSFSAGFYLLAVFVCIDVLILCYINLPKATLSSGMCKGLAKILSSKQILIFGFGVVCTGMLNSTIAMYEFWYLQDLGASKTLLGLTVTMQCLVGEVPFLFFSGWFVKKLGHFLCFVTVFTAFALRLTLYSLIRNPWFVLPVDILHGVTFGIYHGAMTSFAKVKAPVGLEATLQGIYGGLYDGLGYGIGSLIAGVGFDTIGARKTFFSASMFSCGCMVLFAIASYYFRPSSMKKSKSQVAPLAAEDSFVIQ